MSIKPVTRASTASRWFYCHEAAWLEPQCPEKENENAKIGIGAHEMAQLVLTNSVAKVSDLVGKQASNGIVFTQDMIDPVSMYIEVIQERGIGYWIEESIALDFNGHTVTGRIDSASFSFSEANGRLFIDDFKYGFSPVEPYMNIQLLIYATGIISKYGLNVNEIILTIIQPRAWNLNGPIRKWSCSYKQLFEFHGALSEVVKAIHGPNRKATTGPHCKHCKGRAYCNAAREAGMNAVDVAYEILPDATTPIEIANLLETLDRAKGAIDHLYSAIKERAEQSILAGEPIPSWTMEPGKGHRAWKDETSVRALGKVFDIDLTNTVTVTPAEAKRRGLDKQLIEELTRVPSTAPKLVRSNAIAKANEVFK